MMRHVPRVWEYNRFWQKEREGEFGLYFLLNRRRQSVQYDPMFADMPEHLRMPRTRGELNRFRLSLKKTIVESHRRKGIPAYLVMARLQRRIRAKSVQS